MTELKDTAIIPFGGKQMHNILKVTEDIYYVGASDRRLALFENLYPIADGVSYNSYLICDEKTALLDTVDSAVSGQFFDNLDKALSGRTLDYIIVNHMEPDHCSMLLEVKKLYPDATIVTNAKAAIMIGEYFGIGESEIKRIGEGDKLSLGRHELNFYMAPMVHWPEVMVTFDSFSGVLFSADAFGTFGALNGNIFADEVDYSAKINEARRYYTNIVGKYGVQVQALLKKAEGLDIKYICPLHGPIWRTDPQKLISKYKLWSSYTPEDNAVMIAYASIYGGTKNAAELLASRLAKRGVKNIVMYDVSVTHFSTLLAECFRCSTLVFASVTYNGGLFTHMELLLNELKSHNLQNRKFALIQNGTWSPMSGKVMGSILSEMKNMTQVGETLTVRAAVNEQLLPELETLADEIVKTLQ